ncbi:hypothetical protein V1514DRAFT_332925 [Lipomyces japonicus]|uniref:uncharacterized protein n=1 Tax=Lipomyces japonicus TaxID=56871 RepID=UPI0034CEA6B7
MTTKKALMASISFVFKSIPVTIPSHLVATGLSQSHVEQFGPFVNWITKLTSSLQSTPVKGGFNDSKNNNKNKNNDNDVEVGTFYYLKSVHVQSADFFGNKKLGFLKVSALVEDNQHRHLPGIVFLRGQSVAMLVLIYPILDSDILEPYDDSKALVVLSVQPRVASGSMQLVELPAGMLDLDNDQQEGGLLSFTAQRELKEECGLEVHPRDLHALRANTNNHDNNDGCGDGIFMSPGACDEQIQFFYCRKKMAQSDIRKLEGRFGGAKNEVGEKITLRVVPFKNLFTSTQDAKALIALALYSNLKISN